MIPILTSDPGDLKIGDEIVTSAGSEMRYYKVTEMPRLSKKSPYEWGDKRNRYIAVRLRANVSENIKKWTNWKGEPKTTVYTTYKFERPSEDNPIVKVDLNYKNMVIIKREEIWTL
jgi:hypothetical protein